MCELEVYHNVQVRKVLNVIYCISLLVLIKIKVFFSQLIRIQA